jgi:hypothetical protein
VLFPIGNTVTSRKRCISRPHPHPLIPSNPPALRLPAVLEFAPLWWKLRLALSLPSRGRRPPFQFGPPIAQQVAGRQFGSEERMGIFFHAAALEPFIWLFLLGKLALGGLGKFAEARRRASVSNLHACKLFPLGGKDLPVIG